MSADPNMTFEVEVGKTVARFRYGSVRDWSHYRKRLADINKLSVMEASGPSIELLKTMQGDETDLAEHLTALEAVELANNLEAHSMLSEMQKKRLQSPSPTPTENSATSAEATDAAASSSPVSSSAPCAVGGDVVCVTTTDDGN